VNASQIRKTAEALSIERADALAEVEGLEHALTVLDPDLGPKDVEYMRERLRAAEAWLDGLAEQEYHAWDAYAYASQAEHLDYLADVDAGVYDLD
jgi:hypothetical protein